MAPFAQQGIHDYLTAICAKPITPTLCAAGEWRFNKPCFSRGSKLAWARIQAMASRGRLISGVQIEAFSSRLTHRRPQFDLVVKILESHKIPLWTEISRTPS